MCLITFNWQPASHRSLLLASNRDEFYQRPSQEAHFWANQPQIYGGKDLEMGGTWLAASKGMKLAAVTNYRAPDKTDYPRSRGEIPTLFMSNDSNAETFAEELQQWKMEYAGFNALLFDGKSLVYTSNRHNVGFSVLKPGIYGLSNHLLNTPWPKVRKTKEIISNLDQNKTHQDIATELFTAMENQIPADNSELPDTGVGEDLEKLLSPIFIQSPNYGTRTTTIISVYSNQEIHFSEKNHTTPAQTSTLSYEVISAK